VIMWYILNSVVDSVTDAMVSCHRGIAESIGYMPGIWTCQSNSSRHSLRCSTLSEGSHVKQSISSL
jgi:hypothetical protein